MQNASPPWNLIFPIWWRLIRCHPWLSMVVLMSSRNINLPEEPFSLQAHLLNEPCFVLPQNCSKEYVGSDFASLGLRTATASPLSTGQYRIRFATPNF